MSTGVVRAFLIPNRDLVVREAHRGGGVDEVTKEVTCTGAPVCVTELEREETVEAARHQGQLQIAVHLQGYGRGQGIHVEEVDAVRDAVLAVGR